jgi:outer membrane protein OmpA-like peptidoglycan-associated protein
VKPLRTGGAAALSALLAAATVTACATTAAPPQLVSARSAYDRAENGPTARLDPADLHTAKETLQSAEQSLADHGDAPETTDLAYVAERRVELAESRGRALMAMQEKDRVTAQMNASEAATVRSTSAALGRANAQLAADGRQLQDSEQRRADAEKRAAQATADLERIASVKQEARGTVITLSGSVLFASGRSELLPDAQVKLADVAKALIEEDPDAPMVVQGYTDSQGATAFNEELSQKRADSVRTYLVSRGIAADRITAQGFGPTRPIADNTSAEGRANNRRVEIVVQPAAK